MPEENKEDKKTPVCIIYWSLPCRKKSIPSTFFQKQIGWFFHYRNLWWLKLCSKCIYIVKGVRKMWSLVFIKCKVSVWFFFYTFSCYYTKECVLEYNVHKVSSTNDQKCSSCIGVQTVDVDMAKNLVTIKGTMDSEKLVEFVRNRSGRVAEIVKQSDVEMAKEEENFRCVHNYPDRELIYAPQLFSDENPNACSVM